MVEGYLQVESVTLSLNSVLSEFEKHSLEIY